MESDARFFRRRAAEETAAADRAVTPEARQRRLQLAEAFMCRLATLEREHGAMRDLAGTSDGKRHEAHAS